jgi:hypothetical protein
MQIALVFGAVMFFVLLAVKLSTDSSLGWAVVTAGLWAPWVVALSVWIALVAVRFVTGHFRNDGYSGPFGGVRRW